MKKFTAILLTSALALSISATAFAAEIKSDTEQKSSDVTITANIAPTYTVTIPASTNIDFNTTSTALGRVGLSDARLEKNYAIKVSAQTGEFVNTSDLTKTIPYTLNSSEGVFTSAEYTVEGEGTDLTVDIKADDWNKTPAGSYEATIIFNVEYIAK